MRVHRKALYLRDDELMGLLKRLTNKVLSKEEVKALRRGYGKLLDEGMRRHDFIANAQNMSKPDQFKKFAML